MNRVVVMSLVALLLVGCGVASAMNGTIPPGTPPSLGTPVAPGSVDLGAVSGGACLRAAQYAVDAIARGAVYSQGGNLPGDPVDRTGRFLPRTGPLSFDCSGLPYAAYQASGVHIGWTVSEQMQRGTSTSCTLADLQGAQTTCWAPGDLAVLGGWCDTPGCHVSLYVKDGIFADCLNHSEGCTLWQPAGPYYETYFLGGYRFDASCAKGTTT